MSVAPLSLKSVSLTLGKHQALQGVTLDLKPGEIIGLIGPNGAGKSTLLRVLSGILSSFSGEIRIGEKDLRVFSAIERARMITYVGAELETDFPLTTLEVVSLGTYSLGLRKLSKEDLECVRQVMEEAGCWEYRDRILSDLSSGERQRAHFARALLQGSKWICLDESFSRLDLHHQARIGALLRKHLSRGFSFIFVSHDLNFTTDWADRCILMKEGQVLGEGKTNEVMTEANLRKLYPDAEILLTPHPVTKAMKVYFRG